MIGTFEDLKRRFPNEWLAVRVTNSDDWNNPLGELIARALTHHEIHAAIRNRPELIAVFYAGEELDPNIAYALRCTPL